MKPDDDPPRGVTLRTGRTVPETVLRLTMIHLKSLYDAARGGSPLFLVLVAKCRDPQRYFSFEFSTRLQSIGLANPDGSVPDDVRDIVLAATEGGRLDVCVVNPLPQNGNV